MHLDKIIAIGLTLLSVASIAAIRLSGFDKEQQKNQIPAEKK
jgi:hypothetical protein